MQIKENNDGVEFTLSHAFDSRLKILNLCYALMFFFSGHYFVFRLSYGIDTNTASTIFEILFAIAMYIASFRFFNKAVLFEKMEVNAHEIKWVEKGLFKSKTVFFDIKKVFDFRFIEKKTMAPHPLAGQSMDYLGFQTTDKLINQLGGDNQIAFEYKGRTISMGADIYSYEFDEIKSVIEKEHGGKLEAGTAGE